MFKYNQKVKIEGVKGTGRFKGVACPVRMSEVLVAIDGEPSYRLVDIKTVSAVDE